MPEQPITREWLEAELEKCAKGFILGTPVPPKAEDYYKAAATARTGYPALLQAHLALLALADKLKSERDAAVAYTKDRVWALSDLDERLMLALERERRLREALANVLFYLSPPSPGNSEPMADALRSAKALLKELKEVPHD